MTSTCIVPVPTRPAFDRPPRSGVSPAARNPDLVTNRVAAAHTARPVHRNRPELACVHAQVAQSSWARGKRVPTVCTRVKIGVPREQLRSQQYLVIRALPAGLTDSAAAQE